VIPISPTLQQILFEQYAHRTSDQWVFAHREGKRDGHVLEKLKKICRRANIRRPLFTRSVTASELICGWLG
jgi:hypothetical protein